MNGKRRFRQWFVEEVLRLRYCQRCSALTWVAHQSFHEKWHEHVGEVGS